MTQADLFRWLLESTCAISAAIVLVLLLRGPLRAAFGANAAYVLWLLLPLSVLAASLPARVVRVVAPDAAADVGIALAGSAPAVAATSLSWLLPAWLAGVVACALWQGVLQRRFRRSLGAVRTGDDGHLRAERSAGLPAVIGLRARIVLPADFEARYSAGERDLILAHERVHLARGDVLGNALLAALRCVYWFNPLAWIAADRFRRDQELACDETVVARHPRARRVYGEAMVKIQLSAVPAPLACHWFGGHPLKERIAMLKRPVPGTRRIAVGFAVAGLAVAGIAYMVWAARPATRVADDATAPIAAQVQPAAKSADAGAAHGGDMGARSGIRSKAMAPPKYPAGALADKVSGKVVLVVDVAADGSVTDARVEKSEPAGVFDAAAVKAAKQWTFNPSMENGKPVAGRVRVPITFDATPKAGTKGSSTKLTTDTDIDHAAYDWTRHDLKVDTRISGLTCDAIEADQTSRIVYCGNRKAATSRP